MSDPVVKPINSQDEFNNAKKDKKNLVVIDCYAEWCGPCKFVAPKIEGFAGTYPDADFYKLDVDKLPEVAAHLGVRAMPTFIFFKEGEKVGEVVGANPAAVESAIKKHC